MANKPLSSEQALDDYFSDLLVEELWDEPNSEGLDLKNPESEILILKLLILRCLLPNIVH